MDDRKLLRRYVDEQAQEAFAELVSGKVDLVYATAVRRLGTEGHLAEDVTQAVFIALAAQAPRLTDHPVLTGWLYTTTHYLAAKALRGQLRSRQRETNASTAETSTGPAREEPAWADLRPVIDEALQELNETDRLVLLLRFFEENSHASVAGTLGVSENAARMRIERALARLRGRLAKRGITSTSAALAIALTTAPTIAAPAHLAASATSSAFCAATVPVLGATSLGAIILNIMTPTKLILSAATATALLGAGMLIGVQLSRSDHPALQSPTRDRAEMERLASENQELRTQLETQTAAMAAQRAGSTTAAVGGNSPMPRWKLLAELSAQKVTTSKVPFMDASGNLREGMAGLFELTPDECAAVTRTLNTTREKFEKLEFTNATVTRRGDTEVVIDVKPFPEAGGVVYDELMAGLAQTLGPERNAAFVTLCGDEIEKSMASFGAAVRKVTITSDPQSKHSRYTARDEQVSANNRGTYTSNYKSRDDLLRRVGTLTKLMPAEF